jgi:P2-related tail formation protein
MLTRCSLSRMCSARAKGAIGALRKALELFDQKGNVVQAEQTRARLAALSWS